MRLPPGIELRYIHAANIPENSSGRLQLTQWLTRADNALTARASWIWRPGRASRTSS